MEFIADILENYPKFFEAKHQEMLWSAIAGPWGLEILKNSDAETVSLARIIVAFGTSLLESKDLYKFPNISHNQQVLCKWIFISYPHFHVLPYHEFSGYRANI
jgi:hypothetical protein